MARVRYSLLMRSFRAGEQFTEQQLAETRALVALLRQFGPSRLLVSALQTLGLIERGLGRHGEGAVTLQSAADLADEDSDLRAAAPGLRFQAAEACAEAGWYEEAVELARQSLLRFAAEGDPDSLEMSADAQALLSSALRQLGHFEESVAASDAAIEFWTEREMFAAMAREQMGAGSALGKMDRDAAAACRYRAAADAFEAAHEPLGALGAMRESMLSWWWASDEDQCLTTLDEAERRALAVSALAEEGSDLLAANPPGQDIWERAKLAFDAARILSQLERIEEAVARARVAASCYTEIDVPYEAGVARVLAGRLLPHLGRLEEARQELDSAAQLLPEEAARERAEIAELLAELDG